MTDKEQITCDCKYCMENPTCYKELLGEQLARKTQEYEALKMNYKHLQGLYKQALKDLDKLQFHLGEIEGVCIMDTYKLADGREIRYDSLNDILDIINKAKGCE